jgi:hypothetical protein
MHVTLQTRYFLIHISQCVDPEEGRSTFWMSHIYRLAFLALGCLHSPISVDPMEHFSCHAPI